MKVNILVCLLGAALVTGCGDKGSSSGASKGGGLGGNGGNEKMTDVTDTRECNGPAAPGNAITDNWQGVMQSKTVKITTTATPDPAGNSLTLSNKCEVLGETVEVFVRVQAAITATRIDILEAKQEKQTNGNVNCSISVAKGGFDYALVGNCLQLKNAGETIYFVKAR